jgi:undecaprenyl diphosphate synthase
MHVAIIMNGNGEWSSRRGLPPTGSRAAGAAALRDVVTLAFDAGVRTLTVYALCTPNSARHSYEISADLAVVEEYLGNHARGGPAQSVGITVIGSRGWLDSTLPGASTYSPRAQTRGARMQLRLVVDYLAHDKALLDTWRSAHPQALEKFHEQLSEIDPTALPAGAADLLIRTGRGRNRSDFMLWETAYARPHNCENPWADFTVDDFRGALHFHARSLRLPSGTDDAFRTL